MERESRKPTIPKTKFQKLTDCEIHLFFVWELLYECIFDADKYKQLAQELRVLVCDNKGNPLMLKLMHDYNFSYNIQPFRPTPNSRQFEIPIPLDADFAVQWERLRGKKPIIDKQVSFTDYVNHGLAVYVKPYTYTYCELVRKITQQMGSGHEAEVVDEPILQLQNIQIGDYQGHSAPLISFGETVLKVGLKFLEHIITNHGYKLKKFTTTSIL